MTETGEVVALEDAYIRVCEPRIQKHVRLTP